MEQIVTEKLNRAERVLQLIPGFQYLYQGSTREDVVDELLRKGYALDTKDALVMQSAIAKGMERFDLYETSMDKSAEQISQCLGLCRFAAGSLGEMRRIDEAAAQKLKPGYLEVIGIRVVPAGYKHGTCPAFPVEDLGKLAAEFRRFRHISIRGCMVQADWQIQKAEEYPQGLELGQYFRVCYETAKLVTTAIPCGMSYINLGPCMEAIWRNAEQNADTLQDFCTAAQIMQHQNETAFYAKLLIM